MKKFQFYETKYQYEYINNKGTDYSGTFKLALTRQSILAIPGHANRQC